MAVTENFWSGIESLGFQIAPEGYSFRAGGYSEIT